MKTIILIILSLMFATVSAQNAHKRKNNRTHTEKSPSERASTEADKAQKELGLTADQRQQWETAARERIEANQPLRKDMRNAKTDEEKQVNRDKMRANARTFRDKTQAMLTPDQSEKLREMQEERRKKHRGEGRHEEPEL
jgi:hypothetical protein